MIKTLITAPSVPAVTLDDIKTHLRIPSADTDSDSRLTIYLNAAIAQAENITGRALITQTWDILFESWAEMLAIILPFGKLQSVTHIKYKDEDGVEQTVSSSDYLIDNLVNSGGDSFFPDNGQIIIPEDSSFDYPAIYDANSITVRIVCGYGDADTDIEDTIKAAILIAVQGFEEGIKTSTCVDALLLPYHLWEF